MPFKNTTLAGFCSSSRAYDVKVFSADPSGLKRATRRELNAKDREKVHAVRRTGACLTCRMLKVPCDVPDPENPGPCKRCLAIASRPHQKGLLAFRESLDIEYTSLQSPKLLTLLSKTVDRTQGVFSLSVPEIMSNIFTWMSPDQTKVPERSIVGALICSDQFHDSARNDGFLGGELLEKFRVMVYSSSLAYVYNSGSREIYDSDLTMRDLHRITYAMGSDLLLFLDTALVPHQLAQLSQEQLTGLFVVIFGIALAVAYSTAVYDSPTFSTGVETGGDTPRTLWQALQQHLSQMLAHYLVILGARLGLVLRGDSEKQIISSLMSAIIYRGKFVWVAQQRALELPEPSASPSTPLTETTEKTEELFVLNIPDDEAKVDPTVGALGLRRLDSYRSTPVKVRSLQTIQNTLKPIIPSDNDQEPDLRRCHNKVVKERPLRDDRSCPTARRSNQARLHAIRAARNKRRLEACSHRSQTEPLGHVQASTPTIANGDTYTFQISQAGSTSSPTSATGSDGITSPNGDATASSTTSAANASSPFEPVTTDLDFDMNLSSDPFGLGWLPEPEPEPEPEPKLPPILGSTTNAGGSDDRIAPFSPSEWGVQSPEPSTYTWGLQGWTSNRSINTNLNTTTRASNKPPTREPPSFWRSQEVFRVPPSPRMTITRTTDFGRWADLGSSTNQASQQAALFAPSSQQAALSDDRSFSNDTRSSIYPEGSLIGGARSPFALYSPSRDSSKEDDIDELALPGSVYHQYQSSYGSGSSSNPRPTKKQRTDNDQVDNLARTQQERLAAWDALRNVRQKSKDTVAEMMRGLKRAQPDIYDTSVSFYDANTYFGPVKKRPVI
ncbi:hypothetical protein V8F20_004987 [Naviculisporaceae sp. PSN 640]